MGEEEGEEIQQQQEEGGGANYHAYNNENADADEDDFHGHEHASQVPAHDLYQCCGSGSEYFPSQIPDLNFFHPGSASKNLSVLIQKLFFKLSEIRSGLFIPDPGPQH
jgi:hypothetical protein